MKLLLALLLALLPVGVEAAGPGWLSPVPIVHTESSQLFGNPEWLEQGEVYTVTGYSCSWQEGTQLCIARHTGERPHEGTVSSNDLPAGTVVSIPALDFVGIVEDTGGGLKEHELDIWKPTYEEAKAMSRRQMMVYVIEKGVGE